MAVLKHFGRHAIDVLLKSFLSNTRFGVYRDEVDDTLMRDSKSLLIKVYINITTGPFTTLPHKQVMQL